MNEGSKERVRERRKKDKWGGEKTEEENENWKGLVKIIYNYEDVIFPVFKELRRKATFNTFS